MYSWIIGIYAASPEEDQHQATDAHAHTKKGRIPIQIKTSLTGAAGHERRHPDFFGLVIVIPDGAEVQDIAYSILQGLPELYALLSQMEEEARP